MSLQPILPISTMNIAAMIAAYNDLAKCRLTPPLNGWNGSRCKLAEKVAILRTRKVLVIDTPKPKAKRKRKSRAKSGNKRRGTPIRSAIMRALSIVSHYERLADGARVSKHAAWRYSRHALLSVGLPYPEILSLIQRQHPDSKVARIDLRWTASKVRDRAPGFEKCTLPQKRPHGGTKGRH